MKQGFSAAGASTRQFKKIQRAGKAPARQPRARPAISTSPRRRPADDRRDGQRFRRGDSPPAARAADQAATYPLLMAKAAELGITAIKVPESFDGIAESRTTVTQALVAEALAYGDMGLALPILAPVAWLRR